MVLLHKEQLQTTIPTSIHTQWYCTTSRTALAGHGLPGLCPTPASVEDSGNHKPEESLPHGALLLQAAVNHFM